MADPTRLFVNSSAMRAAPSSNTPATTSMPSYGGSNSEFMNSLYPSDQSDYVDQPVRDIPQLNTPINYNMHNYACQELLYRNTNDKFTCGACLKYFDTICDLHDHLGFHGSDGSYHYDHNTRTAFPKYDMVCADVQTDVIEQPKHELEKKQEKKKPGMPAIDSIVKIQPSADKVHVLSSVAKDAEITKEVDVNLGISGEQVFDNINLWMQINAKDHAKMYGNDGQLTNADQNGSLVTLKKLTPGKVITTKNLLICVTQKPTCFIKEHSTDPPKQKGAANTTSVKEEAFPDAPVVKVEVDDESMHVDHHVSSQDDDTDDEEESRLKLEHFCHACKIEFVSDNYLQNHLERHESKFPCDYCFNTFADFSEWTTHICKRFEPRRLSNIQIFQCSSCEKVIAETNGVKGHVCTEDEEVVFRPFSSRHKSSLNPVKNFSCEADDDIGANKEAVTQPCDNCSETFADQYRLHVHKLVVHAFPLKCEKCSVFFKLDEDKRRHEEQCLSGKIWQCYMCYRSFPTKFYLNKHLVLHKVLRCEKCSQSFPKINDLKRHRQSCLHIAERIKTQECDVCKKRFYDRRALRSHRKKVHCDERSFICEICGSTFKYANALKKHGQTHLPERPSFKCEVCDATFYATECLRRHKKRHSDNRFSEQCNICGKLFMERWNLKAHMRQHTGEKPYNCDVCGQSFTHNVSRKTHMRNHHGMFI